MKILGIETSCDETTAAIVEDGTEVLSHVIASSVDLHKKTGGIIPEVAAREQVRCIIPVIEEAIESCKLEIENLDALAVTVGPGLIGSLLVGVETARTLAWIWGKPLVPVNHLQAHLYANFIRKRKAKSAFRRSPAPWAKRKVEFPAVCLVVSGGHTDLVLMENHGKIRWLGGTRDDAAGECFDKCSRLLNLGYPGGPAIERAASELKRQKAKLKTIKLPRPMIKQKNYDFSFSGLKTAVINQLKNLRTEELKNKKLIATFAAEIQEAIVDCLVTKTVRAAREYKAKSILLAGGVSANKRLKEKISNLVSQFFGSSVSLFVPPVRLCTDNAAIIASCAYFNYKPVPWEKIKASPSLGIGEMV